MIQFTDSRSISNSAPTPWAGAATGGNADGSSGLDFAAVLAGFRLGSVGAAGSTGPRASADPRFLQTVLGLSARTALMPPKPAPRANVVTPAPIESPAPRTTRSNADVETADAEPTSAQEATTENDPLSSIDRDRLLAALMQWWSLRQGPADAVAGPDTPTETHPTDDSPHPTDDAAVWAKLEAIIADDGDWTNLLEQLSADAEFGRFWRDLPPEEGRAMLERWLQQQKRAAQLPINAPVSVEASANPVDVEETTAVPTPTTTDEQVVSTHGSRRAENARATNEESPLSAAAPDPRVGMAETTLATRLAASERYLATRQEARTAMDGQAAARQNDTLAVNETQTPVDPIASARLKTVALTAVSAALRTETTTGSSQSERAAASPGIPAQAAIRAAGAGNGGGQAGMQSGFASTGHSSTLGTEARATGSSTPGAGTTPLQAEIFRQLLERAQLWAVGDKQKVLTVQLRPEHLGKVDLAVSSSDGVVTARVVAENPLVKQLLDPMADQIRARLEELGVRFEHLTVDIQHRQPDERDNDGLSDDRRWAVRLSRRHRLRGTRGAETDATMTGPADAGVAPSTRHRGAIDLTA